MILSLFVILLSPLDTFIILYHQNHKYTMVYSILLSFKIYVVSMSFFLKKNDINFDSYHSRFNAIQSKICYSELARVVKALEWEKTEERVVNSIPDSYSFMLQLQILIFSGLPDKTLHFFGKTYILSLCLFSNKIVGKNPTFFVESKQLLFLIRTRVKFPHIKYLFLKRGLEGFRGKYSIESTRHN